MTPIIAVKDWVEGGGLDGREGGDGNARGLVGEKRGREHWERQLEWGQVASLGRARNLGQRHFQVSMTMTLAKTPSSREYGA